MTESEIAKTLESVGFVLQPKRGIAIDAGRPTLRYSREGVRGSFYATDDYLSATGPYARLRDKVSASREDRKGYPVWHGDQLAAVLKEVFVTYADADQPDADQPIALPIETEIATEAKAVVETHTESTTEPKPIAKPEPETQETAKVGNATDTQTTIEIQTEVSSETGPATKTKTKTKTESEHGDSGGLFSIFAVLGRFVSTLFGGKQQKD